MAEALPLSEIQIQILWNRLISVVEEQAQTLIRTAFSASTREAGDLSAGVFDAGGAMLAQAVTGTPGHVNSMARSVGHFIRKFTIAAMKPGDAFITNDPWLGTGHLNDVVVVTPAFRAGNVVAFFAATVHIMDIGGRGTPIENRDVYEEGLCIPICRLVDAGAVVEPLLELMEANVRDPVALRGDLYSLVASNAVGVGKLMALMDEYRLDCLEAVAAEIFGRSEKAMLAAIAALPHGSYRHDIVADGVDVPIRLSCRVTIDGGPIKVDFSGSDTVSPYAVNVPMCYTEAYASFGLKCVVAPDVPNNAASLACMQVFAPEGCILNASRPAPVVSRYILGQILPDLVIGCLGKIPGIAVPAESASPLWPLILTDAAGLEGGSASVRFTVGSFHSGGTGGRPVSDGLSATAFPSGVRNMPVEITETLAPVLFWEKEYVCDSGGPGRWRGGLGQKIVVAGRDGHAFACNASFDRTRFAPRGRDGGIDGTAGSLALDDGAVLTSKGRKIVPQGRRLVVVLPGGGGYGEPRGRDPDRVADDVRNGLISLEAARTVYGMTRD